MNGFAEELAPKWEQRGYDTADFGIPTRAFLLRLRPGESIHRHVDAGDVDTIHVVLQTNESARNYWMEEGVERSLHMEQGKIYRVNRLLEHWARNDGETDRIHLLVEYPLGSISASLVTN